MTTKKAILLTILGIVAAWLIIRGIHSWEDAHPADKTASARVTEVLCRAESPPPASVFGGIVLL